MTFDSDVLRSATLEHVRGERDLLECMPLDRVLAIPTLTVTAHSDPESLTGSTLGYRVPGVPFLMRSKIYEDSQAIPVVLWGEDERLLSVSSAALERVVRSFEVYTPLELPSLSPKAVYQKLDPRARILESVFEALDGPEALVVRAGTLLMPGWSSALRQAFEQSDVGLVAGPVLARNERGHFDDLNAGFIEQPPGIDGTGQLRGISAGVFGLRPRVVHLDRAASLESALNAAVERARFRGCSAYYTPKLKSYVVTGKDLT